MPMVFVFLGWVLLVFSKIVGIGVAIYGVGVAGDSFVLALWNGFVVWGLMFFFGIVSLLGGALAID